MESELVGRSKSSIERELVRKTQEPCLVGQTRSVGESTTFRLEGHVATITYNRPDALNAVNGAMRRRTSTTPSHVFVMTTRHGWRSSPVLDERSPSALIFTTWLGRPENFAGTFWEKPTLNSFESGWEIFKPVIAAVNGYCLGYGLTLATWCDFVLASDRAEFGLPEVGLGVPAIVASIRLPQRLNWADALELLLLGERIDAKRAHEMGLVWKVVPHDSLIDEANALAGRLVRKAPLAQRAMKETAMRTRHMATLESIRFGETMRLVAASTLDAVEGQQAALEKRPPHWMGR